MQYLIDRTGKVVRRYENGHNLEEVGNDITSVITAAKEL